ncbi:MAG TPA: sugar phosphate nucleotidyltransferase, partial [Oligoflexia bacterium]|nr:sugar phosphate nucleotidyltransferase [Oligoflexia bacterium]
TQRPKQFLPLAGTEQSLIRITADRVEPLVGKAGILVVTAENQKGLVLEHIPHACILAEPLARNTAPCIGFAAKYILQTVGDVPMLCLPADHVVYGTPGILAVYREALALARTEDALVTIGIKPDRAETGYGYIQRGEAFAGSHQPAVPAYAVAQFVEKPDMQTAQRYLDSGEFFWNSGMFAWRPSVILREIARLLPGIAAQLDILESSLSQHDSYSKAAAAYAAMEGVSIDTGVLEKAEKVIMLSGSSFSWSDVGSWSSWSDSVLAQNPNAEDNVVQGEVLLLDSSGCTVVGGKKLIAGVGLSDLIIIDTEDALLVCRRSQSQDVKKVVDKLKAAQRSDLL